MQQTTSFSNWKFSYGHSEEVLRRSTPDQQRALRLHCSTAWQCCLCKFRFKCNRRVERSPCDHWHLYKNPIKCVFYIHTLLYDAASGRAMGPTCEPDLWIQLGLWIIRLTLRARFSVSIFHFKTPANILRVHQSHHLGSMASRWRCRPVARLAEKTGSLPERKPAKETEQRSRAKKTGRWNESFFFFKTKNLEF